jgi:hypothetical protein
VLAGASDVELIETRTDRLGLNEKLKSELLARSVSCALAYGQLSPSAGGQVHPDIIKT